MEQIHDNSFINYNFCNNDIHSAIKQIPFFLVECNQYDSRQYLSSRTCQKEKVLSQTYCFSGLWYSEYSRHVKTIPQLGGSFM